MSRNELLSTVADRTNMSHEMYGVEALVGYHGMVNAALDGGSPVLRYLHEGMGDKEGTLKYLTSLFGPHTSFLESDDSFQYVFVDKTSFFTMTINKNKKSDKQYIDMQLVTTVQDTFDKIEGRFKNLLQKTPPSNSVLALVNTPTGLGLRSLGEFNQELLTCNYASGVIKGYEHVKACLASKEPCGRLVLFQGAPGTGKSYMIRSLVSKVDSTFIIVGSNMIADLSGPAVLPTLLSTSDSSPDGKPITFILEDADVALADRKSAGMNHLSGLLNLGDGLLGDMMDVRIVATTNAGRLDLDKAIIRPGRMCQHITFDALSIHESNALYAKLVGAPDTQINKPLTLAEIYRLARRDGWVPPKPPRVEGQYV